MRLDKCEYHRKINFVDYNILFYKLTVLKLKLMAGNNYLLYSFVLYSINLWNKCQSMHELSNLSIVLLGDTSNW